MSHGAVGLQRQNSASKRRIVLSDASPLIGLSLIGQLGLLPALFGDVYLSPIVLQEVLTGKFDTGEPEIRAAIALGWLRVCDAPLANISLLTLDPGETQSILQACTLMALGFTTVLIMDEKAGRAAAQELGLHCLGTAAVVALAKQKGLIPSAAQVLEDLFKTDFRLSKRIMRTILATVGETIL